jgi:hypothetical protein
MVDEVKKSNEDLEPDARRADEGLLGWLRLKYGSGLALLKKERTWTQIDQAMRYVEGKHTTPKTKAISSVVDNRLRKIALETVATMTDVRPIWNYETYVEAFKKQGDVLNKLARAWWRNTKADRRLGSSLLYAACGGSGYALLTWNKDLNDGDGDMELVPFDPRDVIPIDPTFSETIQDWRGVILRQRLPIETVKRMYPSKAASIIGKETTWAPTATPDYGRLEEVTGSPLWDLVEGTGQRHHLPPGVDLMRAYLKDDSLNLTDGPIEMGEGEWAYTVHPIGGVKPDGKAATRADARLYPRGRLVIFTPEAILKDIPNPHWHGKFPVIRFCLDPLPWTLLGSSMIGDLIPMQDTLNEALRGTEDGLAQWVKRGVAADKRSMPKSALSALDSRAAGPKIHFNAATGEPFKFIDGPDPQVFKIFQEIITMLKEEMDDISGMKGVQHLSQLGQMPSADTMERFMEAQSPVLRLRSRAMEISLTELAEMLKVGFFQWYTTKRRIELLGLDGVTREDFNYQPGDMLPDGDGTRQHRAMKHHKLFSFQVSPNSWLNVSHSQQKMFMLQLLRANLMDPWTIWDQFDVPDAGPMPAETVPERIVRARELGLLQGPTPEMVKAQNQAQLLQSMMMAMQMQQMMQQGPGGAAPPGPMGGGPKPPGAGGKTPGAGNPVGRPPSGQTPPHFEMKDQGTRPVISESR